MKLSLVIPVYNERNWISSVIAELKKAPYDQCKGLTAVEWIFVDDGSTDGTREFLADFVSREHKTNANVTLNIQYIPKAMNGGKGTAVRVGIDASTGDVVLIQDADLEYSPLDYPILIGPIADGLADAVFGTRFASPVRKVAYFWHTLANRLLTLFSNVLTNLNLGDMEVGYKAVRGELMRRIRLTSNKFGIEPELTARLSAANARIYEVPIRYNSRTYAQGKKIGLKDAFAAFYFILKYNLWDRAPYRRETHESNKKEMPASKISVGR